MRTLLCCVLALVTSALIVFYFGCLHDMGKGAANATQIQEPGEAEMVASISKEKAISIANMHFERSNEAGCFVERRGNYFFVAPPFKRKADSERAGVYIHVNTGELFHQRPEGLYK